MLESVEERGREVNEEGLKSDIKNCYVQSKWGVVVPNCDVTVGDTGGISRNAVYFTFKLDRSNSQQNTHIYSNEV
jgi:hypothetical protein